MTERLRLPEALAGPFDHAVICTYNAQLDFYEHDLWRKLGAARNRVVLADDRRLAEALADAAQGSAVLRHLNVDYVASPITNPGAAHAKFILLLGPEAGLLHVGSGNLSLSGYANQGELFCTYIFDSEHAEDLGAFLGIREFLNEITGRGYVTATAQQHLTHMWADTPWIYGVPIAPTVPFDTASRHRYSTSW